MVEISPDAVVAPGVATASSGAEADLHVDLAPPSSWWGGPASEDCTTGPCPLSDLAARRWARREVGPTLEAAVRSKCPGVATVTAHSTTHRAAGVRVRPAAAAPCATRALAGVGGVVVGVEARRPLRAAQQFSVPVVQSGTTVRAAWPWHASLCPPPWVAGLTPSLSPTQSAVPFHTNGLKGEGESIAVADTGLDATTCFLGGEVAYRHRDADGALGGEANTTYDRVVSYDAYADTEEERNGHGTFVVGTVMGALRVRTPSPMQPHASQHTRSHTLPPGLVLGRHHGRGLLQWRQRAGQSVVLRRGAQGKRGPPGPSGGPRLRCVHPGTVPRQPVHPHHSPTIPLSLCPRPVYLRRRGPRAGLPRRLGRRRVGLPCDGARSGRLRARQPRLLSRLPRGQRRRLRHSKRAVAGHCQERPHRGRLQRVRLGAARSLPRQRRGGAGQQLRNNAKPAGRRPVRGGQPVGQLLPRAHARGPHQA